jgi:hypothetical protein
MKINLQPAKVNQHVVTKKQDSLSLAMPVHHTLYILFVAAAGKFGDQPTCLSRVALTNMSP